MVFEFVNLSLRSLSWDGLKQLQRGFFYLDAVPKFHLPHGLLDMREHPSIQHVEVWRIRWLRDDCDAAGSHKFHGLCRHMGTRIVLLQMDL